MVVGQRGHPAPKEKQTIIERVNLFRHVARPLDPGAEGAGRARSATEAFLQFDRLAQGYRRKNPSSTALMWDIRARRLAEIGKTKGSPACGRSIAVSH